MKIQVTVNQFYPEELKRKSDLKKYDCKGTCEVSLTLGPIEMSIKNITYRIDHAGKISLKPPFRVHSNKKAGIKPTLVPSIVFKDPKIWDQIEKTIQSELHKQVPVPYPYQNQNKPLQLDFWEKVI